MTTDERLELVEQMDKIDKSIDMLKREFGYFRNTVEKACLTVEKIKGVMKQEEK